MVGGDPAVLERRHKAARQARIPRTPDRGAGMREMFGRGHDLFDGPAAARQDASKLSYRREHLVVPVAALSVIGSLLILHDFLVLAEDILGKPGDEWPDHV